MTPESLGEALARLNAGLNLTSAVLLLVGLHAIRGRRVRRHRVAMLGAVGASTLFLVSYLLRLSLTGTHRFQGEGLLRTAYLALLLSHMVLAAAVVPLVLRLLHLVLRRRFHAHGRLARWTLPVWLYVAVTGFVVYLLLYELPGS